mmetsp:Transcript_44433/g.81105  ORF Transcript_44433/g.81105 Transcript_44433/m.81105 type:complete len:155 (-) Transcript_44433:33-497(-)
MVPHLMHDRVLLLVCASIACLDIAHAIATATSSSTSSSSHSSASSTTSTPSTSSTEWSVQSSTSSSTLVIDCPPHQYLHSDGTCWYCPNGQVVDSSRRGCEDGKLLQKVNVSYHAKYTSWLSPFEWTVLGSVVGAAVGCCGVLVSIVARQCGRQ